MAKNPNQKQKLLYIMQFFMKKTDEDYGVTVADIIEYLAEFDIAAERKSIYNDIETLRAFGLDIVKTKVAQQMIEWVDAMVHGGEQLGFYLAEQFFYGLTGIGIDNDGQAA